MTEETEHHVETLVHGRYLLQAPAGRASRLLVGFHGYGLRAEHSMETLRGLALGPEWARCAVQALHPFYLKGQLGVGASWMTSLDRERAIAENVAYIDRVLEAVAANVAAEAAAEAAGIERVAFLGFSQGVALAYRAAAKCMPPKAAVVSIGGDVPPELTAADFQRMGRVLHCRGETDPFFSAEMFARDRKILARGGAAFEPFSYSGAHEVTDGLLERITTFLAAL